MTASQPTPRLETDTPTSSDGRKRESKRVVDSNQRRAEIVIASLFLVTALASIPAAFALDPILNAPDYLARVFPERGAVELGALMWSINNIGIVFIAVFAFPVLRTLDEALATGYLACRIIEGTIMMVGIVATFLLIPVSQQYLESGASQSSSLIAIGEVLKHARFLGLSEVSLPILGLGGLIFTGLLSRFRLVPLAISVIGLTGYALVFAGGISGWFDLIDVSPGGNGSPLAIPVAAFEIILLPFWLFYRGFNMPENRAG
jgi:uncharacterized protein DUF4386